MISQKTKYGLKAVIFLAKNYEQGPILITDLAKKEHMPQKFLEAILLELKKKGILQSKKGKGGGYALARPSNEIMLGEIVRVLDGPLADVECSEEDCEITMLLKEVRDAMSNVLDKTSLTDMIEKAREGKEILNFVI
jgi:Rrf2 family protein